jgi:hypothetical protein
MMQSKGIWTCLMVIIAITYVLSACKKSPKYPITPIISYKSFSKDTVNQNDSVIITIKFTDGDGDIGWKESERSGLSCLPCVINGANSCLQHPTRSAFLIDTRDSCLDVFDLPYINSAGNNPSIEGTIDITKFSVLCKKPGTTPGDVLAPGTLDSVVYYVAIKDRAQHISNFTRLPAIYVHCDH